MGFAKKLIDIIINELTMRTMEGEIVWSSVNVLDLLWEVEDKEHMILDLDNQKINHKVLLRKEIEFMALKGYTEERIMQATGSRRRHISELSKRRTFAYKTKMRLDRRAKTFDLSYSTGWYVNFKMTIDNKNYGLPGDNYRCMINKREDGGIISYDLGCDTSMAHHEKPLPSYSSEDFPVLYTLGILLNKEDRTNRVPETVYLIKTLFN